MYWIVKTAQDSDWSLHIEGNVAYATLYKMFPYGLRGPFTRSEALNKLTLLNGE